MEDEFFCQGIPNFRACGAMSGPQWPGVSTSVKLANNRACPLRRRPKALNGGFAKKGDALVQKVASLPDQRVRGKLVWVWWVPESMRPQGRKALSLKIRKGRVCCGPGKIMFALIGFKFKTTPLI
eukprot:199126-Pelagomonas_calceolata.AAC.1